MSGPDGATCVRLATRDDVPSILRLVRELAAYEREPDAVVATESDLARDGFGDGPRYFEALLASVGAQDVGLAFYFFAYSTWRGRPTLYVEDLYVAPEARRRGIGTELLSALARTAEERGCARMAWSVLDWNEDAKSFYRALGASVLGEWESVRLEGAALARLAACAPLLAAPPRC